MIHRMKIVLGLLFLSSCTILGAAQEQSQTKASHTYKQNRGFVAKHKKRFFMCTRYVDELLERYSSYYTVNEQKRSVKIKKELTSRDKTVLLEASKELDTIVELFSSCSPGDHDYLQVKEEYLPLAKEYSHRLHTYVMQPLRISNLDMYDHFRKILTPPVTVLVGVGVILLLK